MFLNTSWTIIAVANISSAMRWLYIPYKNEKGEFIDDDGNVIPDPEAAKTDMLNTWFDTMDGIESEFEQKAENIGAYIKQLEAERTERNLKKAAAAAEKRLFSNQIGNFIIHFYIKQLLLHL